MDPVSPSTSAPVAAPPTPPTPYLAGYLAVALVDAVVITIDVSRQTGLAARAALHFRDAFQLIAIGLVVTGLSWLHRRVALRLPRLGALGVVALVGVLGAVVLREDLSGPAQRMPHIVPLSVWTVLLTVLAAQAVLLAALLGRLLARRWLRLLGCAVGVAIAAGNGLSYPRSYEGGHLLAAGFAAALIGASLRGAPLLDRITPRSRRLRLSLLAVAAVLAAVSILVRPANDVVLLLSRRPSVVLEPFLYRAPRGRAHKRVVPDAQREWFTSRARNPPIPPSQSGLLPARPIVLLIGIDSLRADLLVGEEHRPDLPTLFALRDRATHFTAARSAGSSTAPSISAIFASKSYSLLHWTPIPDSAYVIPFPHTDPTPRFPELLAAAGVATYTIDSAGWLLNQYGIVRGFTEESSLAVNRHYSYSKASVGKLIKRLDERVDTPLFAFVHLLDAHFPYDLGGKQFTPYEKYVAALAGVDKQLENLLQALDERGLTARTTLIIMSDHGEAFGEHGLNWHASSLYDELLRVPLLFVLPGGRPQAVADPVSLLDLGPTILDLMGVPTPGVYMGQSLVGFLRGERPTLLRPIVAEGQLKRAMVLPDGFKVIHNTRSSSVEMFDLHKDPGEERNLFDESAPAQSDRFGVLETYFDVNTFKRKGYKVPYRKW